MNLKNPLSHYLTLITNRGASCLSNITANPNITANRGDSRILMIRGDMAELRR